MAFPGGLMNEARLPVEAMTAPLGTGERWLPEHLALLETIPKQRAPLFGSELTAPRLRLHLEREP